MTKKIIILGAGPTGLATGYGLAEKDCDLEIYEASNIVGGLGASEKIDNMIFDYGPHIYHTDNKELQVFWKKNFGDLLTEKQFYSKNHKDGVLYDYPLSYESIDKFPTEIKKKVLRELKEIKSENIMRAQNFKEAVTAIVGPTLQNLFFESYSKKLWGIPTNEMSAKWAPKRIQIRKERASFWGHQYSAAGKYGSGAIMNKMAEFIKAKNNKIFTNHKVIGFEKQSSNITKLLFKDKKIDVKDCIIVSTLPINVTSSFLGYDSNLEFNSYFLVYIVANKDEILPEGVQSIYFAHDENYFHRVTEQKKYSSEGYKDNKTILCFEVSYRVRPDLQNKSENQLIKEVFQQFCKLGFCKYEVFDKGFVRKFPNINPIMKLGFEEELAKVNSLVNSVENLHSIGGAAQFSYGDMQVMFLKANDIVDLLTSEHYVINKNLKSGSPFSFNKVVTLGKYNVGNDNPTLIIAEIGINHQGNFNIAKDLIDKAKESGCEYAKIQTYKTSKRLSATAKSAKYAEKGVETDETTFEMFDRVNLHEESQSLLFKYAQDIKFSLTSTPFDEESVDFLVKNDVDFFKISSFDLVNLPLIKYIASKKKPIVLSTGMAGISEIEEALDTIASQENPNVVLLHCISSYPTSPKDVNLKAINTLQNTFKIPVGYSDHTIGDTISIASIAMGAHVLERHFTLNKLYEGSDHILSSTPEEMKKIVETRNTIFSAFGNGIKKPNSSEFLSVNLQRKSIFSKNNIKKGMHLDINNITIKGPGHGIAPKYLNLILGRKVITEIQSDTPITWDDLLDK